MKPPFSSFGTTILRFASCRLVASTGGLSTAALAVEGAGAGAFTGSSAPLLEMIPAARTKAAATGARHARSGFMGVLLRLDGIIAALRLESTHWHAAKRDRWPRPRSFPGDSSRFPY